jgi:hypothetical protein
MCSLLFGYFVDLKQVYLFTVLPDSTWMHAIQFVLAYGYTLVPKHFHESIRTIMQRFGDIEISISRHFVVALQKFLC